MRILAEVLGRVESFFTLYCAIPSMTFKCPSALPYFNAHSGNNATLKLGTLTLRNAKSKRPWTSCIPYLRSCSLNSKGVILVRSKASRLTAEGLYLSYITATSANIAIALASSFGPGRMHDTGVGFGGL